MPKLIFHVALVVGLTLLTRPTFAQKFPALSDSQRITMLQPPAKKPVPMVLDTDTYNEIDDQFALVYALISLELRVEAVYAAPFLNNRSTSPADGMERSKDCKKDHFAWSKVLWDMTAMAWVANARWLPSDLVHSPIVTDNYTFRFDQSRHLIRCVNFVQRDPIFRDFFTKLQKRAAH